jgi:hypothetical protein
VGFAADAGAGDLSPAPAGAEIVTPRSKASAPARGLARVIEIILTINLPPVAASWPAAGHLEMRVD